ncbi:MAG: hypothetical protein IT285_13225 [Bdellovibrionales bacterium]|nr:hypothetical protein [Bdellovibrionales bacterium]
MNDKVIDVDSGAALWAKAQEEVVTLMAQPIALPRPAKTETAQIRVKAVHDGSWIAFLLRWKDSEKSEAGILGKFSDGAALQFPVGDGDPPPIFMGARGQPVHIFHWRAQYQRDAEKGKPEMTDLYPNMNPDMYPMEFKDPGSLKGKIGKAQQEVYSHGKAAGNPQSYLKSGVDEIFAEGFGSSSVIENADSKARGKWSKGEWSLVITRPLERSNGSVLKAGSPAWMAFAVWQGDRDEVGSRKSVTMSWLPLEVK